MNKLVFIGGSKGVGKSTLSKKISKELGFDYINTGDKIRSYRENFHQEFTKDLISLRKNTLIDTHYAASSRKSPYNFEMGMLEENLIEIGQKSPLKKYVIYLSADPGVILKRRLNDKSKNRCLELGQICQENEINLNYSKLYSEFFSAIFQVLENENQSVQQVLKVFGDLLK